MRVLRLVRNSLVAAGLVAGAVVLAVVGASYSYTGTGRHPYCGRCHEIKPMVEAWGRSTHRNVTCESCHGGILTFGIRFHLKNLQRVVDHARGTVPAPIRLGTQDVLEMQDRCRACHAREFVDWQSGPHGVSYEDVFLDRTHNEKVALVDDCLRCHGMFLDGDIAGLVTPLDRKGPWRLVDASLAGRPVMPCLTCHAMHRDGRPEPGRHTRTPVAGATQPVHTPSLGLFDRRSQELVPVEGLSIPVILLGDRALAMSPDGRQALCYQCHAALATRQAFSGDDRTTSGVHEGLSCLACHQKHGQRTRASCAGCHPRLSNCGLDVEKMDTTFRSPESGHDVHSVTCVECHPKGVPPPRPGALRSARPPSARPTGATITTAP